MKLFSLESELFSEMNPFWEKMEETMQELGLSIGGLFFAIFSKKEIFSMEKIGEIYGDPFFYLGLVHKNIEDRVVNAEETEAVVFGEDCVSVVVVENEFFPELGQALALLWLIAREEIEVNYFYVPDFWPTVGQKANEILPDNGWVKMFCEKIKITN